MIVSKLVLKHGVEESESILEKRSARLCFHILTSVMVIQKKGEDNCDRKNDPLPERLLLNTCTIKSILQKERSS